MSKLKYLKFFFIILICVNFKAYAINQNQYLTINKLIEAENINQAFNDLKLLQKNSNKLSARSQILIGKIYLAMEKPGKAFTFFEKATFTSVSTDDLAYAGMALSSVKLGNLTDAKKYAEKALKENPDLVDARLALAYIYADYGKEKISDNYFKEAIIKSSNSLSSIRAFATVKMRQGKHKEAKNIIENALLEKKPDAPTTDLLGKISWITGNLDEAIRLRAKASEMFKKAGNTERAEKILLWLNTTVPEKQKNNKNKKTTKPRQNKIKKEETKDKKLTKPKKNYLKPQTQPEEIFVNKNKPTSTGSGVILNNGKWVLTNKHVIENSSYIIVRNGLGKVREVERVKLPQNKYEDLAILILKNAYPENYSLSIADIKEPDPGEQIYVMGYPMSSILGRYNPSISQGIVSKTSGFGEISGEFQITAKINLGNSGGPIFNNKGEMVGISVGKLNKGEILKKDGYIPEDVNVGISGNVITNFINFSSQEKLTQREKYDATQIYKIMRPSVVFIVSQ